MGRVDRWWVWCRMQIWGVGVFSGWVWEGFNQWLGWMSGHMVDVSGKGEGVCLCVWIRRNDRMHGGSRIGRGGVCAWVCV